MEIIFGHLRLPEWCVECEPFVDLVWHLCRVVVAIDDVISEDAEARARIGWHENQENGWKEHLAKSKGFCVVMENILSFVVLQFYVPWLIPVKKS